MNHNVFIVVADWLQGPSTYPLYREYGYELNHIAILFVVGFLSSAVFGTMIGSVADRVGRKFVCVLFTAIYSASCLTKLSSNFAMLLFGRLLGGIATSLLFSVFEAWMVSEHHSRGFKESLVSDTFSWSTFLNGIVAIASGVVANLCTDYFGLVAPFMASMFFLIVAAVVIIPSWRENYGTSSTTRTSVSKHYTIMDAVRIIWHDKDILAIGIMQCFFESTMYTFVFLWAPVLETAAGGGKIPFGVVFASMMVCIMLGSILFKVLLREGWKHEQIGRLTFIIATVALILPIFAKDELTLFATFNLFEFTCGLYFPTIGTLRAKLIPEETRSTIMNVFRIPLNLIVVVALLKVESTSSSTLFALCTALMGVSILFASRLNKSLAQKAVYKPTVLWKGEEPDEVEMHGHH
ncbi:hypothetical protein BC832DRAFT_562197 [Gaertneriomyces semiglobifer]|nr:hypothetical protein BC832DRAFT_568920 [Gaertneriomyces semiglobifer]KAI9001624.1 hypothetical protein BC832DRAFT_562197 [Gaertneriomyces semiglobifer]